MSTKVKSYTVFDVIKAECTLEPMKCIHCNGIGFTTYHQYVRDAYCENCDKWQLEELEKNP